MTVTIFDARRYTFIGSAGELPPNLLGLRKRRQAAPEATRRRIAANPPR